MGLKVDLTGKSFNRLTVIEDSGERYHNGGIKWLCLCVCGNYTKVRGDSILRNETVSCGCYNSEQSASRSIKHGQNRNRELRTKEYDAWRAMISRCTLPSNKGYHSYGGRGIKVCDQWLHSFETFFSDMGERPSPKHSLDRYPNPNGNYEKNNCRWATIAEQARNKRSNRWIEFDGEKLVLADWAKKFNVTQSSISGMLRRGKAFSEVVSHYERKINGYV